MTPRFTGIALCLAGLMLPATAAAQNILDGVDGVLGSACEADADCLGGLACIQASSKALAGCGPARGLCTAGCTADSDCAVWGIPGFPLQPVCESVGGTLLCVEGCFAGLVNNPYPSCHLREDVACQESGRPPAPFVQAISGECIPLCSSDAQCASRHCSPALGLCQDEAVAGDPVGTSCDPEASEPTCAGFCEDSSGLPSKPSTGAVGGEGGGSGGQGLPSACSQHCVVNGPVGCGWSGEGIPKAACLRVQAGRGPGDVGQCHQLCNCDAECSASGFVCVPGVGDYGVAGACAPAAVAKSHLPQCQVKTDLGACIYGDVRACKGAGDCFGSATCLDDKSGYAACECVDAGLGGGGQADGGADGGVGGESLNGAESLGGVATSAGGVAGDDGSEPKSSHSGKTPAPGCSCSVPPVTSGFGWLTLVFASGLFVRPRRWRSGRRPGR